MTPTVVLIVGRSRVGKSTVSDCIARALNGTVINLGNLIAETLLEQGSPVWRRATLGPTLQGRGLVNRLLDRLESDLRQSTGIVVLDGVRLAEIEATARECATDVVGLHLTAPHPLEPTEDSPYDQYTDEFAARADIHLSNDADPELLCRRAVTAVVHAVASRASN